MAWESFTLWGMAHIAVAWGHMRGMWFESDVNPSVYCVNKSRCHLGTQLQNSNGVNWARSQHMTLLSDKEYILDVTANRNIWGMLIGHLTGAEGPEEDGYMHVKYELNKIIDQHGQPTKHWPAFVEYAGDRLFTTTVNFDVCMLRCEGFLHTIGLRPYACPYCKRHCAYLPVPWWIVASLCAALSSVCCLRCMYTCCTRQGPQGKGQGKERKTGGGHTKKKQ